IKASNFQIANLLIQDMTQQGFGINVKIFTTLIHKFALNKDLINMEKTLEVMTRKGIKPDSLTWNTIIWAYLHLGKLNSGMIIYSKMISLPKELKQQQRSSESSALIELQESRELQESQQQLNEFQEFQQLNELQESQGSRELRVKFDNKRKLKEIIIECLPTLSTYHSLLSANIIEQNWENFRK
ncbi:6700_t:CDS:1, partial [Dentiscutata erythropus]